MSALKDRLRADLTTAMKARDELRSSTLRMVLTAITNAEVAGKEARELSDDDIIGVLSTEAKRRREAAVAFEEGGRAEMVHPDHVAYYSYSTLRLLVERHRMQVDNFLFYDIGKEHRPHNRWFLNLINDVSVAIAPQWADGIIAVCSLRTEE